MANTHSLGNHQYLIAKEVLEADVVINLPKLKTHKKAGITCALKNLVGINGNKEYLPHHRIGGSSTGGDCYPGKSVVKRTLETVLDFKNMTTSKIGQKMLSDIAKQLERTVRFSGDKIGVEGAWMGNETVARMTLDLNRILLYGRADGTLSNDVQRLVLNVVDAVIAGQGDGPLASEEFEVGAIIAGANGAAIDWVGAQLLSYEPGKIPLLDIAFTDFRWPIAHFVPNEIKLVTSDMESPVDPTTYFSGLPVAKVPIGWEAARSSRA
jgi:hypothetical protein